MGLPVEVNNLMMGSLGGYNINRSLRFRSSASAYLNRTFGTGTSTQKGTLSVWIKRGVLGNGSNYNYIFDGGAWQAGAEAPLVLDTTDKLTFYNWNGSAVDWQITTSAVLRDPSAWYHIIASWDSTQSTAANRVILYINGVQQTALQTASYPSQNANLRFNDAIAHSIGRWQNGAARYFDGYMAEFNFIDGQQLTPSSFGAYDTNGVWQPKKYTGTYGTNGFYLPFSNTTSTTTLVADSSGNGNNWTPNNISLTAGTTYDSMIDSPTVSASASNYAVLNPLNVATTLSSGNLNSNPSSANWLGAVGTVGFSSGKFYYEATITATTNTVFQIFGIARSTISNATIASNGYPGATADGWGVQFGTPSYKINNGTFTALVSNYSYTTNDVIMIAVDVNAGKFWYGKNGTWIESGDPTNGTNALFTNLTGTIIPMLGQNTSGNSCAINFGQRPFTYTPPTGFNALNTYNLPAPSIANGAQYMAATLYTGTGANATISNSTSSGGNNPLGSTFYPDLTWIKSRSAATDHKLTDSVRGATKALISNTTGAETTDTTGLTAFSSTGFTIGTSTTYNNNAATYVAWQWTANAGSTVSNTSGSITSTVSANPTAGFSIVTYTGTGANATVGHGLGVAPNMIIVKNRTSGVTDWAVYHSNLTSASYYLFLNSTQAQAASAIVWNNTAPTSSVFSIGTGSQTNGSTNAMVAYCFAAVSGYSAFGSYTGNGSTDGPFVYTGFRPRWVMIKRTDSTADWVTIDSSRDTYNQAINKLFPDLSGAESSTAYDDLDLVSNGFKIRGLTVSSNNNASGGTYLYAAFAENPFNYSRAR